MSVPGKPVPPVTADTRPFWDRCRRGELTYQRCTRCGRIQFYPRVLCVECGGRELDWHVSKGLGTVYAVTVVYRAPSPAFRGDVPYAVALVDLDDGFRMMANVVGCDPDGVAIGDRVRLCFEERGEAAVPQFTPVEPRA
jgi:uncharacterized OB-fold protein